MSVASLANTTVTIRRKTTTQDASGGNVQTWANHLRLKMRVQPLSGDEIERYSRDQEQVDGKAYADGAPDIKAKDQMLFRDKIASVVNVRNPDELDRFTVVEFEYQEDVLD